MKEFKWSDLKNEQLRRERGVTFEEIIHSRFIGIEGHPSKSHQSLMVFEFQGYAWVIPYVISGDSIFLKTAFPSRKHSKKYLGRAS